MNNNTTLDKMINEEQETNRLLQAIMVFGLDNLPEEVLKDPLFEKAKNKYLENKLYEKGSI
jgi:hypothetical protein